MGKGNFIVYCATAPNGRSYIGQTIRTLQERRRAHENVAHTPRKGKPECRAFNRAMRKYGTANFRWTVLCRAANLDELNAREAECIMRYNTLAPNGYNLASGGGNSRHHPETRKRMSASIKNSAAHKAAMANPEYRARISGENNPAKRPEVRAKISVANRGKKHGPHSAETRTKISVANRGVPKSAEHRAKLSAASKEAMTRPDVRAKQSAVQKAASMRSEVRAKRSAAQRRRYENPAERKKSAAAAKMQWADPEKRAKLSAAMRGKPAHNRGKSPSAEARAKMSAAAKARWRKRERNNPFLDI